MKITGLFHGNIEEEEVESVGEEAEREQRPAALASAVGRHTAAVDVELSEPGSCFILSHTLDCLHGV